MAAFLIWAQRRFRLRTGMLFALYVAAYTAGRAWVEALRVDHANHILGLRLNDWTSLLVFLAAVAYLWYGSRRRVSQDDGPLGAGDQEGQAQADQPGSQVP